MPARHYTFQIRHLLTVLAVAFSSWIFVFASSEKTQKSASSVATADSASVRFLMGMAPSEKTMISVPTAYCSKPLQLQKTVWQAYLSMHDAAAKSGVKLTIISGMRDFTHQMGIWNGKYSKLAAKGITGEAAVRNILKYSSMPGTSRHHWGTDMDLNSLEPGFFLSGDGLKMLTWMRLHAGEFGFCEVYSPRSTGRTTGYEPEPWHWSYMPLAKQYLQQYKDKIGYNLIQGDPSMKKVSGILYANKVRIKEDFIQGINQCQ